MDTLIKNKTAIVALVILILGFLAYSILFSSDQVEETVTSGENTDILELSQELSNISFDQELFTSPGYMMLKDFSAELEAQPTGRSNPFGAIGQN